jgi:Ni/Co efflux regulator RcnB
MEKIMKMQKISAAAWLAAGLLAGAVAQAQPGPGAHDHHPPAVRSDHRAPMARPMHRPPPPSITVGRPLPSAYRGYNYRVDNWQRYHLPRPRRNHYWVQYGAQFLLINPTGVVLQVFAP